MSFSNSCKNEFWMLDFHLSLPSSVVQLFGKETLKGKLHMRKVGIQGLNIQKLKCKPLKRTLKGTWDEGAGSTTNTLLIPSILLKFNLFMVLADILSIVLRSCPGTTGVNMNFVKRRKPRSYHPKFTIACDQKENYERKRG